MDNLCKILIVDDEYLLRQGIRHLVDWKREGFEIVGDASNGKEALDLIESLKPHIVISDIVMPVMDGLELVKVIKDKYPEIQIVILSGYSDFNYVKGTFKLGVSDYILKPKLNPEDVLLLVKNIASNIPDLVISTSENELNINGELSKLISGFESNLTEIVISKNLPYDSFVLIGTDTKKLYDKNSKSLLNLKAFLSKKAKLCLNEFIYYELDINKDLFVILINFENKIYSEVLKKVNNMLLMLSLEWPDIFFISSNVFDSLNKLKYTYNDNFKALLGYKFFLRDKKLITSKELFKDNYNDKFDFKYFSDKLYALNITAAFSYLEQYISNSIIHLTINELELKTLLQNALYNIINILDELHFDVKDINNSKIEYFQKIDDTKYADELLYLLKSIEADINIILSANEPAMNDETINRITQYIFNHYNEQLSLKEIADKFHFNYYYLSSYFSSHISEGFSEYLNKIRVEKALELLKNKNISVSEVSYLVGYSDHSYFCKVFKKFTRTTPSKFRKKYFDL